MRRRLIALRHVAFEDLGLIAPVAQAGGWDIAYRDATLDDMADPALQDADLLVVLGGPIGIYEGDLYPFLKGELAAIERRLKAERPLLGICLGAQAMAQVLGGRVYFGGTKEIGFGKVTVTDAGRASALAPLSEPDAEVLHWHGDTFDLPEGAMRLASNAVYPNQAFSVGAHALATQFHIEADPDTLERWLVGHACELAKAEIDIVALRAEAKAQAASYRRQAERVFARWLTEI